MARPTGRLPVGLLIGPVPNNREPEAFTIQRFDHTPKQYEENGQIDKTPQTQENPKPEELEKRHDKLQSINEEKYKGIEYKGLPGMKSHIGPLVVAPDGQEKERRDGTKVGKCSDKVVRETGLSGIGHNPSFFEIRSGQLA
jgi:hypothetical protein